MAISTPMLVTFCVYIFGMILIGFIAWRQPKTLMTIFLAVAVWGRLLRLYQPARRI